MKKSLLLLPLFALGLLLAINTSCDKVTEECNSDEVCPSKDPVTVCCTDGKACVYKYDGNEYPDTDAGLTALLAAMNCTSKSANLDCQINEIELKLQELLERTRIASIK